MKKAILLPGAALMLLVLISCAGKMKNNDQFVFTAVSGKIDNNRHLKSPERENFKTVRIGKQVWKS